MSDRLPQEVRTPVPEFGVHLSGDRGTIALCHGCRLQVAFCKLTQQAIALLRSRTPTVALNGYPQIFP
ncbi:hypothetical protein QUA85_11550 [Microcoleus sp. F8-C4]